MNRKNNDIIDFLFFSLVPKNNEIKQTKFNNYKNLIILRLLLIPSLINLIYNPKVSIK